ncbi:hypothetical protein GXB81_17365 [Paraburkholderia sp. Ac-20336]|uniref:hypothetical protein n=1 Tax=Paraburkholderia sp. Ac-20336 TaxID=2703886 RepID=UPI00197F8DF1|nr:hypothetical protein [Paraburkholderia sp. Ac-20336]MBN3804805.1 hypothetical protein [Paraburkholderia sp. Ac-20336]
MKLTSNIIKGMGFGTETRQIDKREQPSPAATSKTAGPLSDLSQIGRHRKLVKARPPRPAISSLVLSTARLVGVPTSREKLAGGLEAPPKKPSSSSEKYQTVGMRKTGLEKDLNNALVGSAVPYLSEKESAKFLVQVKDGHLYQEASGEMERLSTKGPPIQRTIIFLSWMDVDVCSLRHHERSHTIPHSCQAIQSQRQVPSRWRKGGLSQSPIKVDTMRHLASTRANS